MDNVRMETGARPADTKQPAEQSMTAGSEAGFHDVRLEAYGRNNRGTAPTSNVLLDSPGLAAALQETFPRLDLDNDGIISIGEIDSAVTASGAHAFTGREGQLVSVLKDKFSVLKGLSNDQWFFESGISRGDCKQLESIASASADKRTESENSLLSGLDATAAWHKWYSDQTDSRLFGGSQELRNSIRPEAVVQGQNGDCYFLAAMASVAQTSPSTIKETIKANEDGTFTVTFKGAPDEPITIEAPTEVELARYAHGSPYGIWPSVLEKAYGQYRKNHEWRTAGVPAENADGGGSPAKALELLTGRTSDSDLLSLTTSEETARKLRDALSNGCPVTASTPGESLHEPFGLPFSISDGNTDGAGLPGNHAYSVISYDDKHGIVTLRNPWGSNSGFFDRFKQPGGFFRMTIDEFHREFSYVDYTTAAGAR